MRPPPATAARPGSNVTPAQRRLFLIVIAVLLVALLLRTIFGHHASRYERIAQDVSVALQRNDIEGVKKYQNAETATHVTASRVGRGADDLKPLGGFKSLRETGNDAASRVHQFDATFANGTLHETIKFDPDDKIVSFHYDQPQLNK